MIKKYIKKVRKSFGDQKHNPLKKIIKIRYQRIVPAIIFSRRIAIFSLIIFTHAVMLYVSHASPNNIITQSLQDMTIKPWYGMVRINQAMPYRPEPTFM